MHTTSHKKMESFFKSYQDKIPRAERKKARVLDVGSKTYEGQGTYRDLIAPELYDYVGLDLEAGDNVDIVPARTYIWPELQDESFEICISGQTFEHNPFFWVTASEMARVLVPGGYLCLIAPGGGPVHRYPMDCWRFYPDSWAALSALVGLELEETYWEPDSLSVRLEDGGQWRDTMLIARKPILEGQAREEAIERRAQLIRPFQSGFGEFEAVSNRSGPAVKHYLGAVERHKPRWPFEGLRKRVAQKLYTRHVFEIYEPEAQD
jgi:SAM-dependent methyltransferase